MLKNTYEKVNIFYEIVGGHKIVNFGKDSTYIKGFKV